MLRLLLLTTYLLLGATPKRVLPFPQQEVEALESILGRLRFGAGPLLVGDAAPTSRPSPDTPQARALARSVRELSAILDTASTREPGGLLSHLAVARNLRQLGLPRRALAWYRRARRLDGARGLVGGIQLEMAATAAASGDSSLMVQILREIALDPRSEDASSTDALAALLEEMGQRGGAADALRLVARLEKAVPDWGDAGRLEISRLHQRVGEFAAALQGYRALLRKDVDLDRRGLALLVKGLADTLFLTGENELARRLYERMQANDASDLSGWASYQLGVLAFTGGRDREAVRWFRSLCGRGEEIPWAADACWQLQQVEEWVRLRQNHAAAAGPPSAPQGRTP